MVSTRSKIAQTDIEDFATYATNLKGKKTAPRKKSATKTESKSPVSKRHKSLESLQTEPTGKRVKKTEAPTKTSQSKDNDETPKIVINRAPVLQLWGACVAHFIYPKLEWSTCISAGSAISTICAVAKGRSIGTISERDGSDGKNQEREEAKKKQKDLDVIEVMQFKLKLKDGLALVGSEQKGKPGAEEPLKKKFGEEQYEEARQTFDKALTSWKGDEDELNRLAFGFYEDFRPSVSKGQGGWGRKGELNLENVKSAVHK